MEPRGSVRPGHGRGSAAPLGLLLGLGALGCPAPNDASSGATGDATRGTTATTATPGTRTTTGTTDAAAPTSSDAPTASGSTTTAATSSTSATATTLDTSTGAADTGTTTGNATEGTTTGTAAQPCESRCAVEFMCTTDWKSEAACMLACEDNLQAAAMFSMFCVLAWENLALCQGGLSCAEFGEWQNPTDIPYPCLDGDQGLEFECQGQ